jgi:hypothetical protein
MSKLILEVQDEAENDYEIIFLSDYRNNEPQLQFDIKKHDKKSLLGEAQITITKIEAIALMKYLSAVLGT